MVKKWKAWSIDHLKYKLQNDCFSNNEVITVPPHQLKGSPAAPKHSSWSFLQSAALWRVLWGDSRTLPLYVVIKTKGMPVPSASKLKKQQSRERSLSGHVNHWPCSQEVSWFSIFQSVAVFSQINLWFFHYHHSVEYIT